jgi:hypothetical protein
MDISELTIFSDNAIPAVLRKVSFESFVLMDQVGILEVSKRLSKTVSSSVLPVEMKKWN